MPPLRVVLLLGLLLAGCAAPAPPGTPEAPGAAQGAAGLPLPAWAVRDWWTYGIEVGPQGESAATYVVVADAGDSWTVGTDSDARAFQDARDDISRLGPQRKSDLAGSQGADAVAYFRFPMAAGLAWTTVWDGQEVAVAVQDVTGGVATLTARNTTHLVYTYTYDADAGWFGRLDRHAPDGAVAFSMVLLDHGPLWRGTVVHYEVATLLEMQGTAATPQNAVVEPQIPVDEGLTDLWLRYDLVCQGGGGGGFSLVLQPQQVGAGGFDRGGQCMAPQSFADVAVPDPEPGTWSFVLSLGGGPVPPTYDVLLLARTRTETKVG